MKHSDLQKKAKELGINSFGMKSEDLKVAIAEAESADPQESPTESKSPKKTSKETPKVAYNAAIIWDANHRVRTYELHLHGENFQELAEGYANDRGYRVELVELGAKTICPACGHAFN